MEECSTLNLDSEHDLPKYIREKKTSAVMEMAAHVAGLAQSGKSELSPSISFLQNPVMQTVSSASTRIILSPQAAAWQDSLTTSCFPISVNKLALRAPHSRYEEQMSVVMLWKLHTAWSIQSVILVSSPTCLPKAYTAPANQLGGPSAGQFHFVFCELELCRVE